MRPACSQRSRFVPRSALRRKRNTTGLVLQPERGQTVKTLHHYLRLTLTERLKPIKGDEHELNEKENRLRHRFLGPRRRSGASRRSPGKKAGGDTCACPRVGERRAQRGCSRGLGSRSSCKQTPTS